MSRLPPSVRRGRTRVVGRRNPAGQHAAHVGGGTHPPAPRDNAGPRWRRGRPAYYGVEWPFWLLMLSPWLVWGLLLLLDHLGVCLICLPR